MKVVRLLAAAAACLFAAVCAAAALDAPMTPGDFADCVQSLADQTQSSSKPLAREDFLRLAAGAKYDDRVRRALLVVKGEPTYWWDELAATTDDQRVEDGRAVL